MMKLFLAPVALVSVLALAACGGGDSGEADAAATATETPAAEAPVVEEPVVEEPAAEAAPAEAETPAPVEAEAPEAAETEVPAADAMAPTLDPMQMLSPEAQEAFQTQLATMTDEEKQQAVDEARRTAEEAARQQGLSDDLIAQVGDQAEAAARQMFGLAD